jgi:hypothetical protein
MAKNATREVTIRRTSRVDIRETTAMITAQVKRVEMGRGDKEM